MAMYQDEYPIETQVHRLTVYPNQEFVDAILPFYNPESQEVVRRSAGLTALRSYASINIEALPGQRFIYRTENNPEVNNMQTVEHYIAHELTLPNKHQLPFTSYIRNDRDTHSERILRFGFKLLVSNDDRQKISYRGQHELGYTGLPEFQLDPIDEAGSAVLDVFLDIPHSRAVTGKEQLGPAMNSLGTRFGLSRKDRDIHRRVDQNLFAEGLKLIRAPELSTNVEEPELMNHDSVDSEYY